MVFTSSEWALATDATTDQVAVPPLSEASPSCQTRMELSPPAVANKPDLHGTARAPLRARRSNASEEELGRGA